MRSVTNARNAVRSPLATTCIIAAVLLSVAGLPRPRASVTTLKTLVNEQRVLAVVPWAADLTHDLLCVISEMTVTSGGETGPARSMAIYQVKGDALTAIFQFDTLDGFVKAAPLFEVNGRLFTVWTGGSAYHFRAYAYGQGRVTQVLETGGRGMPEIEIDGNEKESILVTEKTIVGGVWLRTPDSVTEIYRWEGRRYDLVKTVPWEKRFTASRGAAR